MTELRPPYDARMSPDQTRVAIRQADGTWSVSGSDHFFADREVRDWPSLVLGIAVAHFADTATKGLEQAEAVHNRLDSLQRKRIEQLERQIDAISALALELQTDSLIGAHVADLIRRRLAEAEREA